MFSFTALGYVSAPFLSNSLEDVSLLIQAILTKDNFTSHLETAKQLKYIIAVDVKLFKLYSLCCFV